MTQAHTHHQDIIFAAAILGPMACAFALSLIVTALYAFGIIHHNEEG